MGWMQSQGMVSNKAAAKYRIDAVSPHGSDMSGQSLMTDDGSSSSRNRGDRVGGRDHINSQQKRIRFGSKNAVYGNNAGNPMNFGAAGAGGPNHLDTPRVQKKWAMGTGMKARKTILDRPTHPSNGRVKMASSTQYPESDVYGGIAPPGMNRAGMR
jgi:hypothetical protein